MTSSKSIIEIAVNKIKMLKENKNQIRMIAITGSGISKGSGIPTFRGDDGLWRNYNAMDLATPHAFAKNPQLVWEWYSWRMGIILNKEPNEAHYSLVKLSNSGLLQWIITQNVDSLHQRAGSLNILEVHGNIFRTKCEICSYKTTLQSPPKDIPKCQCGNNLRPDVVWFGETLNQQIISQAYDLITNACDILLVVGTSGVVYPIADFPFIAKRYNAFIIEFNVDTTPISIIADYTILGKAEETLPIFTETILKEL